MPAAHVHYHGERCKIISSDDSKAVHRNKARHCLIEQPGKFRVLLKILEIAHFVQIAKSCIPCTNGMKKLTPRLPTDLASYD